MARKWERHYNTTRTSISYGIMLFGICFMIPLVFLYPQWFSSSVFDSRLANRLVLNADDYSMCDIDYENFIIDEPATEIGLYSFYIFNITNAADVYQRGNKPNVEEVLYFCCFDVFSTVFTCSLKGWSVRIPKENVQIRCIF
jgi:hypothetical protein